MKGGRTSAQTVGLLSNRSQRGVCVSHGHITMVTWLAWRQSFLSASCPPSFVHISLSASIPLSLSVSRPVLTSFVN